MHLGSVLLWLWGMTWRLCERGWNALASCGIGQYVSLPATLPWLTYYHDDIVVFWDWFGDSGFMVTPFWLTVAMFAFGCVLSTLHLFYMIWFKNFDVARVALKTLSKGICPGSKVFWTLLFSLVMYLCYDTMENEPMNLVFSELLLWAHGAPAPVAKISRKALLWCAYIWDLEEVPKKPELVSFYENLLKEVYVRQKENLFTPENLSEIAVGFLCDCYRGWQFFWSLVSQALTAGLPAISNMVLQLPQVMRTCIDEKNITFQSLWRPLRHSLFAVTKPLKIIQVVLVCIFHDTLLPIYVFIQVKFWTSIQKSLGRLDEKYKISLLELSCNYDHRDALAKAVSMGPAAVAELILEKSAILCKQDKLLEDFRQDLGRKYQDFIKLTGTRAVEWRLTVVYLCQVVNWHRRLMDTFMNIQLNHMHGIDPSGPHAIRPFRSSHLAPSEPLKNGLHVNVFEGWAASPVPPHILDKYAYEMGRLLDHNNMLLNKGRRIPWAEWPSFYVPPMDLFSKDTIYLDIHFPQYESFTKTFGVGCQPLDPTQFKVPQASELSIEDFAAKGDVEGYFENLPTHLKKQRDLAHPFCVVGLRY